MFSTAEEAIAFTREQDVKFIDVRFIDLPGVQQHFNIPVEAFNDEAFSEGLMFDGSSIRGFQAIHESDMMLLPDVTTAQMRSMVEKLTVIGLPGDSGFWQMANDLFDIDWDLLDERDLIVITNAVGLERTPRLSAREAAALLKDFFATRR